MSDPRPSDPANPPQPSGDPPDPAPAQSDPPTPTPASSQDWRDRRIAQMTARLHEVQERLTAAEARAAAPPTPAPAPSPPADHLPRSEVDRLANERAAQIAATQRFNDACLQADSQGSAAFPETWRPRVDSLKRLIQPNDADSMANYNDMINTAIETGKGPLLIHKLGGDLNEAMRILSLPPVKRAMELQKMAQQEAPEGGAQPRESGGSSAPRPITPVEGRGPSHTQIAPDDPERADKIDTATWMARRAKQTQDRGGEPWARGR